jgi:hypothetical protein
MIRAVSTNWQAKVADGLSPQEVAAGLSTTSILIADLRDIAARWLAVGRDSPTLRELGGAPADDAANSESDFDSVTLPAQSATETTATTAAIPAAC